MFRWILLLLLLLTTGCASARSLGQYSSCLSNLKNVGTALEMYSTDAAGRYPARLAQLVPNYLVSIPTCPTAGRDTYSANYVTMGSEYAVHCDRRVHDRQRRGAASPPAHDSVYRLQAGSDAAPHDLATCRERLVKAGRAQLAHRLRTGSGVAIEVDLVQREGAGDVYGTMVLVDEGPAWFRLACAGAVHVRAGLPPFTPFYDSRRGLVEAAPDEVQQDDLPLSRVLLATGGVVLLLACCRRRRLRTAPA